MIFFDTLRKKLKKLLIVSQNYNTHYSPITVKPKFEAIVLNKDWVADPAGT